jgi:uncharacterized membrane protein YedE/YeeE
MATKREYIMTTKFLISHMFTKILKYFYTVMIKTRSYKHSKYKLRGKFINFFLFIFLVYLYLTYCPLTVLGLIKNN